jgi:hypothetical protein
VIRKYSNHEILLKYYAYDGKNRDKTPKCFCVFLETKCKGKYNMDPRIIERGNN